METAALVAAHVRELDRCNQRGGRMLSLVDLLEAGTVDLPLAGYLAAAMRQGSSLLAGAVPGGAGKTTVMAALLNWLPDGVVLRPADGAMAPAGEPSSVCCVAHEIGRGPYFAYVWGQQARDFFALTRRGYLVATNLHADTLEQTRQQLGGENGVPAADLERVHLKVYLRAERGPGWSYRRAVSAVWENDGSGDRLIWTGERDESFRRQAPSTLVTADDEARHAGIVGDLQRRGLRRIEEVRGALLSGGF